MSGSDDDFFVYAVPPEGLTAEQLNEWLSDMADKLVNADEIGFLAVLHPDSQRRRDTALSVESNRGCAEKAFVLHRLGRLCPGKMPEVPDTILFKRKEVESADNAGPSTEE